LSSANLSRECASARAISLAVKEASSRLRCCSNDRLLKEDAALLLNAEVVLFLLLPVRGSLAEGVDRSVVLPDRFKLGFIILVAQQEKLPTFSKHLQDREIRSVNIPNGASMAA